MIISLSRVTIESNLYTNNVPISVDDNIIIGGKRNYRTNICDIFLEENYSNSAFEEISTFFDSPIDSCKWQISLLGTEDGLYITKFPWHTAKLSNNALLDLEFEEGGNGVWSPDDYGNSNTSQITKGRYYSPDGDDVEFQPDGSSGIKLTRAHIVSDHNVVYDGKWDGHVAKDGFRVKITYPDGSFFEGDVKTDFLERYNRFVGLNIYKILNSSNLNFLKPNTGTLTKPNGEKETIEN